ncbi:NfeD family protein [Metabacillus malikii]|uniref:Membrane-bound ClpP family serine protease n=1 Tax=Metabacillus malikii TaxID=1504265 RepID=A0ABT9ZKY1_9BACI|nr:NfeD family protein [Metabacillus malikii]MDQ0232549.1 membrane-bound ClpP family serine protease [Metabacillus malikii]
MEILGISLESLYLVALIIAGAITLIYILIGDVLEGSGFLNPTLLLSFITILSGTGFLLEKFTNIQSIFILLLAVTVSLILVTILNLFVFIPLSKAEQSLVYTNDSLKGRVGKVITTIPKDGFGEVVLNGKGGTIAKSAVSFDEEEIKEGKMVLVIDVKNGVLHVSPHEVNHSFTI